MKKRPVGKVIVNVLVILLCCVWLVPVYMVIVNAFKSRAELYENIFAFPKHFTLEYFQGALKKMDFLMAFKNSIIVTVIAVGIIVLLSAMTAWDGCSSLTGIDSRNSNIQKRNRNCKI